MSELEIEEILKRNKELEKLLGLKGIEEDKSKAFSKVTTQYLNDLKVVEINFSDEIFENWFNNNIKISDENEAFLKKLLNKYGKILAKYNEDTLKVKFIGLILEEVSFTNFDLRVSDFYNAPLNFKNNKINFGGFCDFCVAKGLGDPDKPYFFIQEYKPSANGTHPEPQLVAELISAVELNNWKEIKGCYIIGAVWNFVVLEKLGKDKYQYFISRDFTSTNINDLKDIFRNLLFVKNEIFDMVRREKEEEKE
jgi:hypothetical protein